MTNDLTIKPDLCPAVPIFTQRPGKTLFPPCSRSSKTRFSFRRHLGWGCRFVWRLVVSVSLHKAPIILKIPMVPQFNLPGLHSKLMLFRQAGVGVFLLHAPACIRIYTVKARENLVKLRPILSQSMGAALSVFYEKLKVTPEVRKFFTDERHMVSAQDRQEKHWDIITAAKFDHEYLEGILRVGKTHARIGLEPRWYIGGYALVLEQLIHVIVKDQWPRLMQLGRGKPEGVAEALSSLVKAAMLDMDFAISTYLDALEAQRKTSQDAELVAKQEAEAAVAAIGFALSKLAQKDLTFRIDTDLPPAFSQLKDDFNEALAEIAQTVSGVSEGMSAMHSGAKEIAVASDDLARRTEQQAASLEETAAALAEITGTAKKASDGANHARKIVMAADDNAKHSTTIVRQAVDAMDAIAKSSQQLHDLMSQFIIGTQYFNDPLRRELKNVAPHAFATAQSGMTKPAASSKPKLAAPASRPPAAKVVNGSDNSDWQEF
eukprot:gene12074-12164_t